MLSKEEHTSHVEPVVTPKIARCLPEGKYAYDSEEYQMYGFHKPKVFVNVPSLYQWSVIRL